MPTTTNPDRLAWIEHEQAVFRIETALMYLRAVEITHSADSTAQIVSALRSILRGTE